MDVDFQRFMIHLADESIDRDNSFIICVHLTKRFHFIVRPCPFTPACRGYSPTVVLFYYDYRMNA
jgi:hypothetical protein